MPRENVLQHGDTPQPTGTLTAFVAVLATALFVALTALVVGQRTEMLDPA